MSNKSIKHTSEDLRPQPFPSKPVSALRHQESYELSETFLVLYHSLIVTGLCRCFSLSYKVGSSGFWVEATGTLVNFIHQGQSKSFYTVFISRMNALYVLPCVWLTSHSGPAASDANAGSLDISVDEKGVLQKVISQGDLIINPSLDRLWWVVTPQAYNFFSKRFLFALSQPCPSRLTHL